MCISNGVIRAINEMSLYLEISFSNQITCKISATAHTRDTMLYITTLKCGVSLII